MCTYSINATVVRRRRDQPFTEEQRQWMLLRRGRYLEFNRESGVWVWIGLGAIWLSSYPILHAVLYDRGVKFGLAGGRFESVMVSGTWIGKTSEA